MKCIAPWRDLRRIVGSFALLGVAHLAQAQESPTRAPAYRHRLLGIFDIATGQAIEGATVTDVKSGTAALTTRTGTVDLIFLPDGGGDIRVRKLGYASVARFVLIAPGDTSPVTMLMTASATPLTPVVRVDSSPHYRTSALRDFEVRRKSGPGHFMSEAELRKNDTRKVQDVVRNFPGVQVMCTRAGFYSCEAVASRQPRRTAAGECRYSVFVDGMILRDPDLSKLNVSDFAGIEAYTAGERIPTRYNVSGNPCGVLLFWTREG